MVKRKFVKATLNDQIECEIRKRICDGYWQKDEKLPSEAELAQMFGVNRLTVRLALQKLSSQGFVETKTGEGTFVKKFSLRQYLTDVSEFYITDEMMNDVCDFRKSFEIECARLAIERATPNDIRNLKKSCEHYDNVRKEYDVKTSEGLNCYIEADLDFHYKICKASHNQLFVIAFNASRGALYNYLKMIISTRNASLVTEHNEILQTKWNEDKTHHDIVKAIENKDFEKCKKVFIAMIDYREGYPSEDFFI